MNTNTAVSKFFVKGMHCASCEILIEKRLIKEGAIDMVDVSLSKGEVVIEHRSNFKLTAGFLNKIFQEDHYQFSQTPFKTRSAVSMDNSTCAVPANTTNYYQVAFFGLLLIIGFVLLNRSGFSSLISVNSTSTLPVFFLFGLLAGFSSCAALVGGIILSLSKQWLSLYDRDDSIIQKLEPHFLFNIGRVLGYAAFGFLLGYVGNFFRLSPLFSAGLVIVVSAAMIILGLQMLGVKAVANFQFRLPKSITGNLADESKFTGRYAPALMGALTFFLPCGFTITTQALALASGSPIQGSLIMGLFALGTVPGLLAIGISSVKFYANPKISNQFSTIAGLLVLFFAIFNINNQLAVLNLPNVSDIFAANPASVTSVSAGDLIPMVNGVQIIKMSASSAGYSPNRFKIRANTPTRWEITASSISGCTNAVMSRSLFDGQIDLVDGTTSVKEFTSPQPGVYKFSCWMGMVSGVMEVVDASGSTGAAAAAAPVGSGAKGCGCGGGTGSCGGSR